MIPALAAQAKRGAGADDIPGGIPVGVLQLGICEILASAISGITAAGAAAPDELETLLRAVPSPLNKRSWKHIHLSSLHNEEHRPMAPPNGLR